MALALGRHKERTVSMSMREALEYLAALVRMGMDEQEAVRVASNAYLIDAEYLRIAYEERP